MKRAGVTMTKQPLRVGIGGPVGSGKTALMEQLCKRLSHALDIAAITNDIYTKEDARILVEAGALPAERIMGVETGGCPHTAIREDASINLAAVADMRRRFPGARRHPDRIGRRQSRRHLLARARRSDDLCHRRLRRRENPAQRRPRHHPLRPPRHQQDRPRPLRRRLARSHGPRRRGDAQGAALRHDQHEDRRRRRPGDRVFAREGRAQRRLKPLSRLPLVVEEPAHGDIPSRGVSLRCNDGWGRDGLRSTAEGDAPSLTARWPRELSRGTNPPTKRPPSHLPFPGPAKGNRHGSAREFLASGTGRAI